MWFSHLFLAAFASLVLAAFAFALALVLLALATAFAFALALTGSLALSFFLAAAFFFLAATFIFVISAEFAGFGSLAAGVSLRFGIVVACYKREGEAKNSGHDDISYFHDIFFFNGY